MPQSQPIVRRNTFRKDDASEACGRLVPRSSGFPFQTHKDPPPVARAIAWSLLPIIALGLALGLHPVLATESGTSLDRDTLLGPASLRNRIEERGVKPFAVWTVDALHNVDGGVQQRGWWTSLLDFGIEVDTEKVGWWSAGRFMAQAHWVQNSRSSVLADNHAGAFNPLSATMASDHVRVFNLHYSHTWREETVFLKMGQLAADDDFMGSEYTLLFLNSAFGPLPSQVGTPLAGCCGNPTAFPIYGVAAPGVFLRVRPSEGFYTQLGLYYGRPGFDEPDNYGFGWASQGPLELGLLWEAGWSYKLAKCPATSRCGLSHHTGPIDDFSNGAANPATTQTVPNFYFVQDVELISDRDGNPKLGVFARGGITPQTDRSMVAMYADAGLNYFSPLPGRDEDVAGIAVSWTRFGDKYRRSIGVNGVAADETTVEFTYKAQVTRWMALQADLQLVFNPAINPRSGNRETATVLGLRAQFTF